MALANEVVGLSGQADDLKIILTKNIYALTNWSKPGKADQLGEYRMLKEHRPNAALWQLGLCLRRRTLRVLGQADQLDQEWEKK